MKVSRGLNSLRAGKNSSIVTIGVFDGVHVGHSVVIRKTVARAKALGLKSMVITFDPNPAKVLSKPAKTPSLISLEHRIRLIGEMAPDHVAVLRFTKKLASLSPEAFVSNVLLAHAGAAEVYVGDNFYFGNAAEAGTEELQKLGARLGFKVTVVNAIKIGTNRISSSRIRKLIAGGRLQEAEKFLGRPVSVLGTVVSGANLARELGYPTANLNPHHEVIPPSGVYAVMVRYGGKLFKGVLNIGTRPTFYAPRDREPAIEVHIFGFGKRIYGHDLEVFFIRKIRDEKKFSGKESLVRQIKKDKKSALSILRKADLKDIKNVLT
jgi:riboflavin kinase/FMN adenylyltransferase